MRRVRVWRDWLLVGVLLALAVVEALVRPDLPWRWATLVVELAVIPTLLWRRTHPGLMAALAFGALLDLGSDPRVRGRAARPTATCSPACSS